MALHIIHHPIAKHLLTVLRNKETSSARFRGICKQLTYFLFIEALRNIDTVQCDVETPLASFEGTKISNNIVAVPILRSGLSMLPAAFELFENVLVGYIGMQRDDKSARANSYYAKLPDLTDKNVYVLDPMLATGGSAEGALNIILECSPAQVAMLSLITAPEGARHLENLFPDIPVYAIAIDERLNERKFIVPGIGDFGDRAFGTL